MGLGAEQELSGVLGGTPHLGLGVSCVCVWCVRLSLGAVCLWGVVPMSLCVLGGDVGGSFYLCVSCFSESLPTVHLFRCGQSSWSYTSDWMQAGVIYRIVASCDGFQSQKTWVHSLTASCWL